MHKYMSIYKTTMLVPILRFKSVLCLCAALFLCCTAYGDIGSRFVIRGGLSISRFVYTFIFIFYVQGESTYTTKIDEWSVGCILLELTIGSPPFRGNPESRCSCPQITHSNFNSDQLARIFNMVGSAPTSLVKRLPCQIHISSWPSVPSRLFATVSLAVFMFGILLVG